MRRVPTWYAEGLVRGSLREAFGLLGHIDNRIRDARAYLLRIATNLWVDRLRRRDHQRDFDKHDETTEQNGPRSAVSPTPVC